jgi:hypothetical protein
MNRALRPRGAFCEADPERDDLCALLPHVSPFILRAYSAIYRGEEPLTSYFR